MNDELLHEIATAIDRCKESVNSLRNEDEDPKDTLVTEDPPSLKKEYEENRIVTLITSVILLHEYDPSMVHAIYVHQQACMLIASYNPTNH